MATGGKGGVTRPPVLNETVDYEQWKKEVAMWQVCCKYEEGQRGPALALSLEGKAKDAVLELELKELQKAGGVELILKTLDGLFLKDENQRMYVAMKKFEQYTRSKGQSLDEYINEFEKNYNRLKLHKITFPDQFLAYRLLENANLDQSKNELIRTTIPSLTHKEMKTQLRKLEDVIVNVANLVDSNVSIKEEPEESFYTRSSGHGFRGGRGSGRGRGGFRGGRGGGRSSHNNRRPGNCHHCGSPEHWVRECPELNNNNAIVNNNNNNNSNNNFNNNRNDRSNNNERHNRNGDTEEIRLTL